MLKLYNHQILLEIEMMVSHLITMCKVYIGSHPKISNLFSNYIVLGTGSQGSGLLYHCKTIS